MSKPIILVIGATGQQGGAVIDHLLKSDKFKVRALTRDVNSNKAKSLEKRGVELVTGDVNNKESLANAVKDVYGVFSVTVFTNGVQRETEDGIAISDAAKAAGVKHLVFTSVGAADAKSGVPHFESKFAVEEHIRKIGIPHTIIRPVFFYENFLWSKDSIQKGTLSLPLKPNNILQGVTIDDIGGFAALIFEHPENYLGKAIEFASDEFAVEDYAKILGAEFKEQPLSEVQNHELAIMFKYFQGHKFEANITEIKKQYPLTDFKTWANKVGLIKH